MTSKYHAGELAIQARIGVQESAQRVSKLLHFAIQPAAQEFLDRQQLAVVSSVAANGRIWASLSLVIFTFF